MGTRHPSFPHSFMTNTGRGYIMKATEKEFYEELLELNPTLAEKFKSNFCKKSPKKKFNQNLPWPLKYNWFHTAKINSIKKKFKFLETILICIGDKMFRLKYNECCKLILNDKTPEFSQKHLVKINDSFELPVLLNLNCKEDIAKRADCSVSSIKDYLIALARIGALRTHNLGDGKRYYSCGYWSSWTNGKSGDEKKSGKKVNFYLKQSLVAKLVDPKEFYLRKPK